MRGGIALALLVVAGAAGCGRALPSAPTPGPATSVPGTSPSPTPAPDGDSLVGTYALDVQMNDLTSGCDGVPDSLRHLTYTAAIQYASDANYVVTLAGDSFLTGLICTFVPSHLGCNQFSATHSGDSVRFDLVNDNDDGHGGHIVAQAPPTGWWFELIGSTTGTISNGTIGSAGSGSLWYCPAAPGYPFPCPAFGGCEIRDLRMTFVRQ